MIGRIIFQQLLKEFQISQNYFKYQNLNYNSIA